MSERNLTQDVSQTLEMARWKGQGHGDCVDNPAKDGFACGPAGITLQHLLDGGGFMMEGAVTRFQRAKDLVNSRQKDVADMC